MLKQVVRGPRGLCCLLLLVLLAGCATKPQILTTEEIAERVEQDWAAMFADTPDPGALISLPEAVARSIKYNLDNRLKLMESVVANRRLNLMDYEKLPRLAAAAGYTVRNKQQIARSINVERGDLETDDSTSQDKEIGTADLQTSWNTLDFGIAMINAKQTADQVMVSVERQRKIVHNIIKDVRYAYWRMISAQRLQGQLLPLVGEIKGALNDAIAITQSKLTPTGESLEYQRALLDLHRQMLILQRDLHEAKVEMTALMGLPPGTDFRVQTPEEYGAPYRLQAGLDLEKLEQLALHNRPELLEEDYRTRIAVQEINKARLRMIPGLELFTGYNYDDNSFLRHQHWAASGLRLSWSLLNLISGPAAIRYAKSEKELADIRRMALSMAVVTQVDIALFRVQQAQDDFGIAREVFRVDGQLYEQYASQFSARQTDRLTLIRAKARKLLSELRHDLSYAEWHNAIGQLHVSVGYQPAAILDYSADLGELTGQVEAFLQAPSFSAEEGFYNTGEARKDRDQADTYRKDEIEAKQLSTVKG